MSQAASTTTYAFAYKAYLVVYKLDMAYFRNKEIMTPEVITAIEQSGKLPDGFLELPNRPLPEGKKNDFLILPIQNLETTYSINEIPSAQVTLNVGTQIEPDGEIKDSATSNINFDWLNTRPRAKIKLSMYCSSSEGARRVIYDNTTIFNGYITGMTIDSTSEAYSIHVKLQHWLGDLASASMLGAFCSNIGVEEIGYKKFAAALNLTNSVGQIDNNTSILNIWPQLIDTSTYNTKSQCLVSHFIKPLFKLFALNSAVSPSMFDFGEIRQNNFSYEAITKLKTHMDDKTVLPVIWNDQLQELMHNVVQNQILSIPAEAYKGVTLWDKLIEICSQFDLILIPSINEFYIQPYTPGARGVTADGKYDSNKAKKISELTYAQASSWASTPIKMCVIPIKFSYNTLLEQNSRIPNDMNSNIIYKNNGLVIFPRYAAGVPKKPKSLLPGKIIIKQPPSWLTSDILANIPNTGITVNVGQDKVYALGLNPTTTQITYHIPPNGNKQTTNILTDNKTQLAFDIADYNLTKQANIDKLLNNRTNLYITYERLAKTFYFNELFHNQMLTILTPVTFGVSPGSTVFIDKEQLASESSLLGLSNSTAIEEGFVGSVRRITTSINVSQKQAYSRMDINHVRPAHLDIPAVGFEDQDGAIGTDVNDGLFSTDIHPFFTQLFRYRSLVNTPDFIDLVNK